MLSVGRRTDISHNAKRRNDRRIRINSLLVYKFELAHFKSEKIKRTASSAGSSKKCLALVQRLGLVTGCT